MLHAPSKAQALSTASFPAAPEEQAEQCMPRTSSLTVRTPSVAPSRLLLTMRAAKPQASTASATTSAETSVGSIRTSADSLSSATSAPSTPGSALWQGRGGKRGVSGLPRSVRLQARLHEHVGCQGGQSQERSWQRWAGNRVGATPGGSAGAHFSAASTADEQELQCMPVTDSCRQASKQEHKHALSSITVPNMQRACRGQEMQRYGTGSRGQRRHTD